MKHARQSHSSIVHGSRLYVFGGRQSDGDENDKLLGNIEFLALPDGSEWTHVIEDENVKRMSSAIAQSGPNQIAVFGGLNVPDLEGKDYASNDYIFDTVSKEVTVMISDG